MVLGLSQVALKSKTERKILRLVNNNVCDRYGSRVELQNRSKYDKFSDDPDYDSDSEDSFRRS